MTDQVQIVRGASAFTFEVTYVDPTGSPIDPADLDQIREAYRCERVAFPWQQGDVLLLDNMAVAHARTPYRGERRIRVGMTVAAGLEAIWPPSEPGAAWPPF